jgi:RND family efflux transporter MFP subunit
MTEAKSVDLSSLRIDRDKPAAGPPGRTKKRLWRIGAVVVAVVVLGVAALLVMRSLNPAIDVKLATVSYTSPSQANAVLTASGYVVAQRKAAVASKGTGRLEYLGVVEGDRVRKGEVIARLEDADIKASLDEAKANLRLFEADLKDGSQTLYRQKSLLDKGLSTQADYDAAEARYNRVLAGIEVAKASVAVAEVALENTRIRAPFDGTVLTKNADVGEIVAPFAASASSRAAVVTIADMSSLEVEADVSESNIERITIKQECEITLDAYPDRRYQGFVNKIVPTADRAKATVMVKVAFHSYDKLVLPEMSAKVLFLTKGSEAQSAGTSAPVLAVPLSAIVERNGQTFVYGVRDDRAVEIPVVAGRTLGMFREIKSGLSRGDQVIESIDDRIADGTRVKAE